MAAAVTVYHHQAVAHLPIPLRGVTRYNQPPQPPQQNQGRTGYLQWREGLKGKHAATVVGLMQGAGYDADSCEKVKRWILKKDIKTDPENQVRVLVG